MTKKVSALGEEGKVAVRNVRRDAIKALGKLGASEDLVKVGSPSLLCTSCHPFATLGSRPSALLVTISTASLKLYHWQ